MANQSSTIKLLKRLLLALLAVAVAGVVSAAFLTPPARADTPIFVRPGGDDSACIGIVNVDYQPNVAPLCAVKTVPRALTLAGAANTVIIDSGSEIVTIPPNVGSGDISALAANIVVDKSDLPDPVPVFSPLTYTVRISNTGDLPANNVRLIDSLPQVGIVSFKSANPSQGGCGLLAPDIISCTLGVILNGNNATVTVVVTPTAAGNIFNNASVSESGGAGGADSEVTRVEGVTNLSVTKSDSPDPVTLGQAVTYTVTISNAGPSAAAPVTLTDILPAGVLVGSITPSPGVVCGGGSTVTCTTALLGSNVTATVRIVVTPTTVGLITNTAIITGGDIDLDPANNIFTETTTVIGLANIGVSKSDQPDPVSPGATLTYTLVVSNAGPATATNVTLTDTLPSAVNFNNASGNLLLMHLDEVTGSTSFSDTSGNNYNGSCSGATCPTAGAAGRFGTALRFDGVNDYVSLGNPAGLNLSGQVTLMAWVNISGTTGLQDIMAHGYTLAPTTAAVFLRINSGNYQAGSWNGADFLASAPIPPGDVGTWVHLAGVYDGSFWRIYRNGTVVNSTPASTGAVPVSGNWAIGARGDGSERFFGGSVDEAAIFNRALSAAEIAAMYQRPLNGSVSPSQGSCGVTSAGLNCNLGNLAASDTTTVTLRVTVASTATGTIVNTASVTTSAVDPIPGNNSDSETTTIQTGGGPSTIYLPIILKNYADPTISMVWDGLEPVRDKVSPANGAAGLTPDGRNDGLFRVTVNMGSQTKTANSVILTTSQDPGIYWDTINTNPSWVLGIFDGGTRLNNADGTITQTISGMFAVTLYASDTNPASLFPPDTHTYTVTINFTDGSSLSASARIPPAGGTPPEPPPPPPEPLSDVSDVAADPDTNQIFIASPHHDRVAVINGGSDTVSRSVAVGNGPTGLAVLKASVAANNKVFVAHQYGANYWTPGLKAFGVNQTSSHDTAFGGYVGAAPVKVAANPGNGRVYVSNYYDKLAVLNGNSGPPETRLGWVVQRAFQGAYGIDVSAVTNRVYLATRDTGELVVFDGNSDRLLQSDYIPTHVKPPQACSLWSVAVNEVTGHVFVPCPQLGRVFVLQESQISVLDLEALGVLEEREGGLALVVSPQAAPWIADISIPGGVGLGEEGIAVVDSSTGYVFMTNAGNDTLVILRDNSNAASIAYVTTMAVGDQPQGVDVNPATNKLYVGNTGSNTVTVLQSTPPFTAVTTIPLTP